MLRFVGRSSSSSFALFSLRSRALSSSALRAAAFVSVDVRDGVAFVRLDEPDSKVNTLSARMSADIRAAMERVESDNNVRAAVLVSAKRDCFIAGADINMLSACRTADELSKLSRDGQDLLSRLLASGKPKVAAIDGSCLGGGLEVALACHYRVASSNKKTSLGLPEVMLGLLPGAGGTQRLPRLIGLRDALPLLLTGKTLNAERAKKAGLVDVVADPAALESAAALAARQLADGSLKPKRQFSGVKGLIELLLTRTPFGRSFVFNKAREQVMKETGGKYPAPLAIIDVVERGLANGFAAGSEAEAKRFGELGMTPQSRALVSIFQGQTALKKNRYADSGAPLAVETIGVLGAGLMGAGIAQVSLQAGLTVLLKDMSQAGLDRGAQQIAGNLAARVKRRQMSLVESEGVLSRLYGLTAADDLRWRQHFARADLVVEAVFEDLALKHKVVRELESAISPHCIVASNTSALPIASIAEASVRPENVLGMHYFSPVDKMPLLEIIPHAGTSRRVVAAAFEAGRRQGKTVIVVKDVPGFYVNRCLGPYMAECMALIQIGVEPARLDKIMKSFGYPVGPISLADEVGIDVAGHVQSFLGSHLGVRMQGATGGASLLKSMLDAKILGRKTGAGFYVYEKETKKKGGSGGEKKLNAAVQPLIDTFKAAGSQKNGAQLSDDEVAFRAVSRFVNEAAYCLQDRIVESAVDADIGAVFGVGFPPFIGGPFRWVDALGARQVVDRMRQLADTVGPQFAPCPLLVEHAEANKPFHEK